MDKGNQMVNTLLEIAGIKQTALDLLRLAELCNILDECCESVGQRACIRPQAIKEWYEDITA